MKITEVRVFQRENQDRKLKAFATITFDDCFVVRDIKIIEGSKGLFVAMPSRRMREPCPKCRHRNAVRSSYCNQCGTKLEESGAHHHPGSAEEIKDRQEEHRDIAHPITAEFREYIQKTVLAAYDQQKDNLQTDPHTH